MEIHQILVAASPGDAITNEALLMRRLFRRIGRSEIFAHYIDARLPDVLPLAAYPERASGLRADNLLVAHASIGESPVFEFLLQRRERLVLRYHNVTPAEVFEPFDHVFACRLRAGRQEVAALRHRTTLAVAASVYNAAELAAMGYRDVAVVPLLVDFDGLTRTPPREPERFDLSREPRAPVVLFVGRMVPNKNHPALLKTHHILRTYRRFDAQLVLVGTSHVSSYVASLERFARELALPGVVFAGAVPAGELAWLYQRADAFLCLSAHEGFCAPLVEAMAFDTPVVAWSSSAIGQTVGDAGILIDQPSPLLAAEALDAVLGDPRLAASLVARGRRRAAQYSLDRTGSALLQRLLEVA